MEDIWKNWVSKLGMLQDGQIWENGNGMVFQIDKIEEKYRVVMFSTFVDELHYAGILVYDTEQKLCGFLESLNMKPTSKFLTIRRE